MNSKSARNMDRDANADPISGAPGAHPIGTGVGAVVGGMAAGAAVGTVAGPIGTAVGAAVGAVVGGLAGKGVAEVVDPTTEEAYWRAEHPNRPYGTVTTYESYAPAYRYGWESRSRYPERTWDQAQIDLRDEWSRDYAKTALSWDDASPAVRDAWNRVGESYPNRYR